MIPAERNEAPLPAAGINIDFVSSQSAYFLFQAIEGNELSKEASSAVSERAHKEGVHVSENPRF
jgi:hypothetical protein